MSLSESQIHYLEKYILPKTGLKEIDEDVYDLVYDSAVERLVTLNDADERIFLNEILTELIRYVEVEDS